MDYIAHKSEDGRVQTVKEHLSGTARRAASFGELFHVRDIVYQMGLLHDLGKYSQEFQQRILENGPRTDHSTAGGIECGKLNRSVIGKMQAYGIAGHHSGLPDGGSRTDTAEDTTLAGRLKRKEIHDRCDLRVYKDELGELEEIKGVPLKVRKGSEGFQISFLTRMMYSCLVDADYLDTERFMTGKIPERGNIDSPEQLLNKFNEYISSWWNPQNEINKKRCEILRDCIDNADREQGLYTLTVPTGGGKTMASLGFALNHMVYHKENIKRIIYVIPYTNIIEQNAAVFANVLGEENVIEHHANISYDINDADEDTKEELYRRKRLATENWDANLIVTTNVQFFESLFSSRPGKCRKLHNIANSVIIFDEAQMLPLEYLQPCVKAIAELVADYHCTAVLCTATQPSLRKFIPKEIPIKEICTSVKSLHNFFERTMIKELGKISDVELVERIRQQMQVMCIVNSRKQAQNLYQLLKHEEGVFHLTTYMTPAHRKEILSTVRSILEEKKPCRLIATSLMETGVDVDFPCVYRARAGLDSIIQAAGRCNREGKWNAEESIVYVFDAEECYTKNYPAFIKTASRVEREVELAQEDISSPEAITYYFDLLYILSDKETDKKRILERIEHDKKYFNFPFRKIDADFKLIDQNTKMLFIPMKYGKGDKAIELEMKLRNGFLDRKTLRDAAQYSVNVYEHQFRELHRTGKMTVVDDEVAILDDCSLYDQNLGLHIVIEEGEGFLCRKNAGNSNPCIPAINQAKHTNTYFNPHLLMLR